jgi:integral membrane protein
MDGKEQHNGVINRKFLTALRVLSMVEGVSTLLLFFVAMPLKYAADMPMAVTIVGTVHGALFTFLVIAFALAHQLVPLPARLAWLGVGAAIIPFGPFWLEPKLKAVGDGAAGG